MKLHLMFDYENTQLILSYFKELSKDGKTIISVTHDREYIPFADVVYELCNGKDTTLVLKFTKSYIRG